MLPAKVGGSNSGQSSCIRTYFVDLGDERAFVVDVSRDLRAVHAAAARRGLQVAFAADTHLHADFLSGAHQLAATQGTEVLASAAGPRNSPTPGYATVTRSISED